MAFLGWIIRFLLWLFVATWLARKLLHWVLDRAPQQGPHAVPGSAPKPLYRDPWCGTYVAEEISHTLEQAGQVHHFCSAECRERYRGSLRRAAGA